MVSKDLTATKKGSIGSKIKEKIDTKCLQTVKFLFNAFQMAKQIDPTLGPSYSLVIKKFTVFIFLSH